MSKRATGAYERKQDGVRKVGNGVISPSCLQLSSGRARASRLKETMCDVPLLTPPPSSPQLHGLELLMDQPGAGSSNFLLAGS
jgi:hypothetical protein